MANALCVGFQGKKKFKIIWAESNRITLAKWVQILLCISGRTRFVKKDHDLLWTWHNLEGVYYPPCWAFFVYLGPQLCTGQHFQVLNILSSDNQVIKAIVCPSEYILYGTQMKLSLFLPLPKSFKKIIIKLRITDVHKFHLTIAQVMIKARLFALFPLNPSRMLLWKSVLPSET